MLARLLFLLVLVAAIPAEARPVLDWLEYDPALERGYEIDVDAGDTARHVVTPRAPQGPVKRVMVLIPIRSVTAYSLAVNTILRVFERRGVPARFDIWYYNRDEAVAQEALDWAYAQPVDLVMSAGSRATKFLANHHTGHPIPAVTSASKDPIASGHLENPEGSGTNIAYTSINVDTDTLVTYLRQLIPDLSTIGVLYSRDNTSAILTQVEPLKAIADREGLTVIDIAVDGPATATEQLEAGLPIGLREIQLKDPDLARSVLLVTGSTAVYERIALINRHAGTVPVISMLPDIVRSGPDSALLSIGVNLTSALNLAAVYAVDVISGEVDPGALPVGRVSPPDLAVNFQVAARIGVRIPFSFLESSTFVYDLEGKPVVAFGQRVF